jgi:hypothetical protein
MQRSSLQEKPVVLAVLGHSFLAFEYVAIRDIPKSYGPAFDASSSLMGSPVPGTP